MGTQSGKLGESVMFRRKGEQITRAYLKRIANPQTRSQMTQRTQLGNIVNMYRSAKRLLDHSFTNVKSNQSSYNGFVSKNLGRTSVFLPKKVSENGGVVVAPYQISDGSLAPIVISGAGDNAVTNIALGTLAIDDSTTVGQFAAALIDNNQSIIAGDQLSYVSFVQTTNVELSVPSVEVGYYEVTLDRSDNSLLSDYMPAQAINIVNGFLAHGAHVNNGGFAWILSRKSPDKKLDCTPQHLIMNDYSVFTQYQGTTAADVATRSYGGGDEQFLDPGESSMSGTSAQVTVAGVTVDGTSLQSNTGRIVLTDMQNRSS